MVGITGNIGSGKSTLGKFLKVKGFKVFDADEIGKKLLREDRDVHGKVLNAFGKGILGEGGVIDNRKLAAIVFKSREKLKLLMEIVHPAIRRELLRLKELHQGVIFVEAAVLLEAGWQPLFDRVLTVFAYRGQRIVRAARRFGIKEALRRESFQLPYSEKLKFTDYLICNTGSPLKMYAQAEKLIEFLRRER